MRPLNKYSSALFINKACDIFILLLSLIVCGASRDLKKFSIDLSRQILLNIVYLAFHVSFAENLNVVETTFEKHYRISDLAKLWGLGRETVRKLFARETGVLKIKLGRKKANTTYSIPESTAQRVHTRLINGDL